MLLPCPLPLPKSNWRFGWKRLACKVRIYPVEQIWALNFGDLCNSVKETVSCNRKLCCCCCFCCYPPALHCCCRDCWCYPPPLSLKRSDDRQSCSASISCVQAFVRSLLCFFDIFFRYVPLHSAKFKTTLQQHTKSWKKQQHKCPSTPPGIFPSQPEYQRKKQRGGGEYKIGRKWLYIYFYTIIRSREILVKDESPSPATRTKKRLEMIQGSAGWPSLKPNSAWIYFQ